MTIIQPKIHTKITARFRSGYTAVIYWPNERHLLPKGQQVIEDRDGVQHIFASDHIEHIKMEHVNAEEE